MILQNTNLNRLVKIKYSLSSNSIDILKMPYLRAFLGNLNSSVADFKSI